MPDGRHNIEFTIEAVEIESGATVLEGELALPRRRSGLVVFARETEASPGGQGDRIAEWFGDVGLGTLQVDLLSPEERVDGGEDRAPEDDAALAARWLGVIDWLGQDDRTSGRPFGLFGVGKGAASALAAAGQRPEDVSAVVTAGGRPDHAGDLLDGVTAPTLLIASKDEPLEVDGETASVHALSRLTTLSRLETIPRSIEGDPEMLAEAASIARDWFAPYLVVSDSPVDEPGMTEDEAVRRKG